jgi:hypothetical protein
MKAKKTKKSKTRKNELTTTLKREWFAEIVAGTKRIDYRKIKPYWTTRLKRVQTPFRLILRNGMTPPVPVLIVRIDRVVTNRRNGEYELHIGRVYVSSTGTARSASQGEDQRLHRLREEGRKRKPGFTGVTRA